MPKPILTKPYSLKGRKKSKTPKSGIVLLKGVQNLRTARTKLMRREIRELGKLVQNKSVSRQTITDKLARLRSLERKANFLIDQRSRQKNRLAMHDPEFTRLLNRQFFFEKMRQALNKKGQHSLVYLDMDKLKQVNKRFGRQAGGLGLLTAYSNALARAVGRKGFAGHIGGDEFVIYLRLGAKDARAFMTSVFGPERQSQLKKWKAFPDASASKRITTTYSAGIIQLSSNIDVKRAEHAADLLCQQAKRISKQKNTFSVRNSLEKFERELSKKRAKI